MQHFTTSDLQHVREMHINDLLWEHELAGMKYQLCLTTTCSLCFGSGKAFGIADCFLHCLPSPQLMLLGFQAKVLQEWDLLQEGGLELGPPGAAPWCLSARDLQGFLCPSPTPRHWPAVFPHCQLGISIPVPLEPFQHAV